ncbi:hypothetical protein BUALT_Bualt07G0071700 [Buddleja alternifolia]|uniref:Uncharacterized protein n=1 Tax=Buddleja alternifolia TaxID=168488 RepID=A0AAV6XFJ8_9LAMI|nr:hypothetical protein BUALT_Bualt07G0071700 [Buddleja alternifolia]
MVIHDKYLEQGVNDERKNLMKFQKRNDLKEFHQLMDEIIQGKNFDEFDLYQLNVLQSYSNEFLMKLQKRDEELNNEQRPLPQGTGLETEPSTNAYHGKMTTETVLEKMKRDRWFIETMAEGQDVDGFMVFPPTTGGATSTYREDVIEQSNDLNKPSPPPNNNMLRDY